MARNKRLSQEEFQNRVLFYLGTDYEVVGTYKNSGAPIEIKHIICGKSYFPIPVNIFSGNAACLNCFGQKRKTAETFKLEVDPDYEVLEDYKNNKTKIKFLHRTCGNEFYKSPNHFLSGIKCPFCSKKNSTAVLSIQDILIKNNIKFEKEKVFKDCKHERYLPFDFYITDKNLLIEYDGEFHYKPIFGIIQLEIQQINDSIKNSYCMEKNIQLVRIPYWDANNIKEIIERIL